MDHISLIDFLSEESEEPPSSSPLPVRPWRVAVIANLKGESPLPLHGPADAGAEFDRRETIQAIQAAIEAQGHITAFIPADNNIPYAVQEFHPDICFNIAEGLGGDAREAQVPAVLEILRIPYTASRVLANALALDKTMTKRIWTNYGLPTAAFQEFESADAPITANLHYPLFVKPAREGTGMGLDDGAIVHNEEEMRQRVAWVVSNYHQPALVEDYLPGREFTVGVLGRQDAALFSQHPEWYEADGFHRLPVLEVGYSKKTVVTPGVYGHKAKTLHFGDEGIPDFTCPADLDAATARKLQDLAIQAHLAIGALDVSRIDMRLDAEGNPRLIEINSLPGLSPGFSDLCIIANADGISYDQLIVEILTLGASRFGLIAPQSEQAMPLTVHPVERNYASAASQMAFD